MRHAGVHCLSIPQWSLNRRVLSHAPFMTESVQHVLDVHGQEEAQSRWFIAGWLQEPAEAALFTDM